MSEKTAIADNEKLLFHVVEVLGGRRRFENAAQSVARMILEKKPEKKIHAGRTVYDFPFFREGKKHIIGWYDEINDFVHFVKNAAEGGSAKEMAIVFVGEPGNGKTFFVEYVCGKYRAFLMKQENRKYTFKFVGLVDALKYDEKVDEMHSLTFEDPMTLAMNLFESSDESKEFLAHQGLGDNAIEALYERRRPLGASTEYLWYELISRYGGDVKKSLEHVQVIPVPMRESLGTTTGKYSAKDKITSSSVDLLGEESLQHLLLLKLGDPNKFDLNRGALARVAGSGIHFSDELFRNKTDLVQIYLQVIQNRNIELDGFIWPIDTLIIATSNNDVYNRFVNERSEAPIKDRCRICYVSHNTDYKLQQELTSYSIGSFARTTITGELMHEDPNLNYAVSVGVVLTRLIDSGGKLTPVDAMKLEAGEIAGEKGVKTLVEVKETANANPDVTKRWGQKGLGHRDLGRILQIHAATPESNEGKCMFAKDVFKAMERIILDYVPEATDRDKFMKDLKIARALYREQIKTSLYNAYRNDKDAVRKDVMDYINMIIGVDADNLGDDKLWTYKNPQNGEVKSIKIDEKYIDSVEKRLGHHNKEHKESFRNSMKKIYTQRVPLNPNYDFMDNQKLVKAVTDVRLESDVGATGSLIGALANKTNDENMKLHSRVVGTMNDKLGYCTSCAVQTIGYFCEKDDES
ncbi:serine protein kinase [Candidatus Giovannonibacteria bacterium RIFCSPLOWO2_12_FULL_44_25]|uniref:PrkA AAA domain-containing protein n=3 Tax=Parcubacteria group TaxID=1794811 RepID=A0A837IQZ8_9BACT|nr:MAG: hypothetical protein UW15_C0001G0012 [Parcubacteria group bacterium GW2011_GWC1_44_10]KKT57532.1 MAG: hypothetical protein UW49_C0003G0011 [Candidatus Giovannonibacteria bacterium GW2011_GWB1_44_23]KKT59793.1 MAG: hypothetical protein UW53_C0007G0011 [Candidatus Giovannonibacteria bacterium GW2011_GWA1_44_25]KKU13121.1 MAG: hypothetical protein UX18_C0001G0012 [Candidatus Azambacteria bacterium GW2011_GWC2_45_7b]OGF49524.1 MAG: serine protein kinase [Candidatus Giovannonibacteria bacter